MRITNELTYLKFAAAFALAGAAAGFAVSFLTSKQYVATATFQITRTGPPTDLGLSYDLDHFAQAETRLLSRSNLRRLILSPEFDLYPREREHTPLEDVIETIRTRDIRVIVASKHARIYTITLSFAYPDAQKARRVVAKLATQIANDFNSAPPANQILENLKPADSLQTIEPNRLETVLIGLAGGLLAGLLTAVFIQHPKPALVFTCLGIGGAVLGWGMSLVLPQRYISEATLRISASSRDAGTEQGSRWLVNHIEEVFSDESLSEMFNRLDLYREDRDKGELHNLFARVRKNDLSYEVIKNSTVFRIRFAYRDPLKAQAFIQAFITRMTEQDPATCQTIAPVPRILEMSYVEKLVEKKPETCPQAAASPHRIEVLDNANLPTTSDSLNPKVAPVAGLLFGLGLAGLATRRRQPLVSDPGLPPTSLAPEPDE
jgi:uncharacterized protein involved in exopolysaccharide biosynthesis